MRFQAQLSLPDLLDQDFWRLERALAWLATELLNGFQTVVKADSIRQFKNALTPALPEPYNQVQVRRRASGRF